MDLCLRPELFASARCPLVRDYGHARQLFLQAAARAGAELRELRPVPGDDLLVTDVAVLRGAGQGLLLHVSGTHGVEGFIGSAIQRRALADRDAWLPAGGAGPTVVFVHALNPFGMAHWRRADEANVDLNRNCLLSPEAWHAALRPDRDGERAYDSLARPVADPSVFAIASPREGLLGALVFAQRTLWTIGTRGAGSRALKRALVAGTYAHAQSLFYGGNRLRPAHASLHALLGASLHGEMAGARRAIVLDVHSGLGPKSKDTLMASLARGARGGAALAALGNGSHAVEAMSAMRQPHALDSSDGAASGYELMVGGTDRCLAELVAAAGGGGELLVSAAQEFGTRDSLRVLKALVEENQAFWRASIGPEPASTSQRALDPARLPFAARLLDVFAPADAEFAAEVVARGVGVLARAVAQLSMP
jgi:hypothetical protein